MVRNIFLKRTLLINQLFNDLKFYMSQMNPKEFVHNTAAYSV